MPYQVVARLGMFGTIHLIPDSITCTVRPCVEKKQPACSLCCPSALSCPSGMFLCESIVVSQGLTLRRAPSIPGQVQCKVSDYPQPG